MSLVGMPIMLADLLYNVSGGNADTVCRSTYDIMSLVGMPILFADLLYNVSGGNADTVCRSTI